MFSPMIIIEKPSGKSEVFASPQEALLHGTAAVSVPISSFVANLGRPEIQAMNRAARSHRVSSRQR